MSTLRIARGVFRLQPKSIRPTTILRRGYADAVSDKINLTLALPHQVRSLLRICYDLDAIKAYSSFLNANGLHVLVYIQIPRCVCDDSIPKYINTSNPVEWGFRLILLASNRIQVNLLAESGEMGVLANHVPSIEQLKPGLVEIIEESGGSKKFFCMLMQLLGYRHHPCNAVKNLQWERS